MFNTVSTASRVRPFRTLTALLVILAACTTSAVVLELAASAVGTFRGW